MIHTSFSSYITVACVAIGVAVLLLRSGQRRPLYTYAYRQPIVGTAVRTGLAAAVLVTLFVATHGHAALVRQSASAHLSVAYVLACGFGATLTVVTVAVLIFLAGRR
jgi:hypothetical protein